MTDITDEGLIVLAGLKSLSSVHLTHTRVTPDGMRWLKQTRPGLQVNAETRDRSLRAIASRLRSGLPRTLPAARRATPLRLNAIGPKVTNLGISYLRGLTSIERLDLTDAKISDAAVNDLLTLAGLKQLLSGTQVTDAGVERLRQALPECEVVQ